MRRSARACLLAVVTLLGIGTAAPSEAVQTPVWTFVVDCADPNGSGTDDFGLDMPNGWYAVAVAGACLVDTHVTYGFSVGTPCSAPVVGAIPCVSPGPGISNVPGALCWTHTVAVGVQPCGGAGVFLNGCLYVIAVDGQCLPLGVGTIYHNPGPMRAHFLDGQYADNVGYYVVTVTWTPL